VLATAESDDLIRTSPCRLRGAGQEHHAERPMVGTELVLELADVIGERLGALVLVCGFGGLRTGEALGLRRCDVDPLRSTVSVVVQAQELAGHGRALSGPKSDAGRRTVVVPKLVTTALVEHLSRFTGPELDAPVFTGPEGGPLRRASLSKAWRAAVRAVGAPAGLRVHDLRHHAATLAARVPGTTTAELMARIGHSSPRAALIYQHHTDERDRAIASALDAVIEQTQRPTRAPVVGIDRAGVRGVSGLAGAVPNTERSATP
jgi:integrase